MHQLSRPFVALALLVSLTGCGAVQRPGSTDAPPPSTPAQKATASPANPDSVILTDFNARLEQYIKLQRSLAKKTPDLEETVNPAEITAAQDVLAAAIQSARKNARQGEIFTPQIAAMFRRLMYPDLKGAEGRETKAEIKEDAPTAAAVPLQVNAKYPATQPLSTVPPNLLARLPQLPKDVEYRIVDRHLILRDVDANIIVDYMPNAIR